MSELNVHQRINAVQAEIGVISKNGTNSFHNYDYATEADFVNALRPLLLKHGLSMSLIDNSVIGVMPLLKDDGKHTGKILTTVQSTYSIVSVDNPKDYIQVKGCGQGADNGDKGVYKAITGAKKYVIANAFMISTGDDPEKETGTKKANKSVGNGTVASLEF